MEDRRQLLDLSNLKHLSRSPLNLPRLPYRLWLQIFKQHPASTQLKLREGCSLSRLAVDEVLEEIPFLDKLGELRPLAIKHNLHSKFGLITEKQMLTFRDFAMHVMNFGVLYDLRDKRKGTLPFNEGQRPFFKSGDCEGYLQWYRKQKEEEKQLHELLEELAQIYQAYVASARNYIAVEDKWKQQRIYGPSEFDLKYLPRVMLQRALLKASTVTVSRLALTCSLGNLAADTCLKSTLLHEVITNSPQTFDKKVVKPWIKKRSYLIPLYMESIWAISFYPLRYFNQEEEDASPYAVEIERLWRQERIKYRQLKETQNSLFGVSRFKYLDKYKICKKHPK